MAERGLAAIEEGVEEDEQEFVEPGHEEEESDEARIARVNKTRLCQPCNLPTRAEVEDHMVSHLPFRSCCTHCVKGKAVTGQHRSSQEEKSEVNKVHMDYMFFEKKKQGEGEEEYKKRAGSPAIVIVDNRNGLIAAAFVQAIWGQ